VRAALNGLSDHPFLFAPTDGVTLTNTVRYHSCGLVNMEMKKLQSLMLEQIDAMHALASAFSNGVD
jgi:hypothetical protein